MRTSYGNIATEPYYFVSPPGGWAGEGTPIIFSVGYGGTVVSSLTGETGVMLKKMGAQFPTMSVNAGGTNTFGNDTARNSITATLAAYRSMYKHTKKVVLVGLSMGFCDLMSWAQAHPTEVAGVVGCVGLADLDEQWNANRDLGGVFAQPTINAAYGGAYSTTTHGPTRSAMQFAGSMPFPIKYFYSNGDELIPRTRSEAFSALPNVTGTVIGSTLHGTASIQATHNHPLWLPSIAEVSALA